MTNWPLLYKYEIIDIKFYIFQNWKFVKFVKFCGLKVALQMIELLR